MKVRLSRQASADLEGIADWIATDNPSRAFTFVQELRQRCTTLSEHPRRFPVATEQSRSDLRKMTHKRYIVFYRVHGDSVEIVRIVNGARDLSALLANFE